MGGLDWWFGGEGVAHLPSTPTKGYHESESRKRMSSSHKLEKKQKITTDPFQQMEEHDEGFFR